MGIFDSLYIGKSGLNASQIQISITGQNITNSKDQNYTRQKVIQQASRPINSISPGGIGTGTSVKTIVRIHDEFVFNRLKNSESNLQNTNYKQQVLEEVADYFPDLEDSGIFNDLKNYYEAWNDFGANANEPSQKTVLIDKATTLTRDINNTAMNLDKIINNVNDQINLSVDEINDMIEQIADINKEIARAESRPGVTANDLRDKRDNIESTLSKLANITTFKEDLTQTNMYDEEVSITDRGYKYNLSINGVTLVEGSKFHKISIDSDTTEHGYGTIYFKLKDDTRINMSDKITSGKLGAMLDLRGRDVNTDGTMTDGILTNIKDTLDTFTKTLVIHTNNTYASGAQKKMFSNQLPYMKPNTTLQEFDPNVNNGKFTVNVYNKNGDIMAQKTIEINPSTSLNDTSRGNSIIDDFNSNTDDNDNNNHNDDVDDYFEAVYQFDERTKNGYFSFEPKKSEGEYFISIDDNGTNFAGVFGLGRFFDGEKSNDIGVASYLIDDNSLLIGGKTPVVGDNSMANDMVNIQNQKFDFISEFNGEQNTTISGYYRYVTTNVASITEKNNTLNTTYESLNKNIYSEFQSISGVDVNEELTNLMQFQASFGASAKVITTVDQMLDTLLGMKR